MAITALPRLPRLRLPALHPLRALSEWRLQQQERQLPPLIDLYLWGTPNMRVRLPLTDARENLGVHGFHVRGTPPLRFFFAIGGALFFALTLGYYAFLFFGNDIGRTVLWVAVGLAIGGLPGYIIGSVFRRLWVPYLYVAWTRWDPEKKVREITPMEHLSAMDLMLQPTSDHRAASLARIGELPMRRPSNQFRGDGQEADMEPVVDSAMTSDVVATYSPKRLWLMMDGKLYHRVLSVNRKTERLIQAASMGTIALSMMAIVALIVLVFTGDKGDGSQSSPSSTTTQQPSPNQGLSNAKR